MKVLNEILILLNNSGGALEDFGNFTKIYIFACPSLLQSNTAAKIMFWVGFGLKSGGD